MSKSGLDHAVEAIKFLSADEQERLLKNVAKLDPKRASELRENLIGFDDLACINPKGISLLFSSIPDEKWSLALRTASPELARQLFSVLSKRRSEQLKEYIRTDGPKPLSQVKKAQKEILDQALEYEKQGKLIFNPHNTDPMVK